MRRTSSNARLRAAGEADVGDVDAEVVHEVEDLELLLDRRIDDGRVLQAVAQRLVEERGVLRGSAPLPIDLVPVEDEVEVARAHGLP